MSWEDAPAARGTDKVSSEISAPGKESRAQWGNQFQFVLTALGLAVGLGNIWRFPNQAYDNGGAAFLIPYMTCGIVFGLPMVYAEFMMGQYSRSGPGLVLGRYAAGWRGVGWCMTVNAISVAIYYCVLIAWALVYLSWIVTGDSWRWTECDNEWNSENCTSQTLIRQCGQSNSTEKYYYNGACTSDKSVTNWTTGAAEEFFKNYTTTRSAGISTFGGFNLPVLGALIFLWLLTAAILIKGITIMGYLSYIIVPFPYIIVLVLFCRGVTLPGAYEGVKFYLLEPDWSKLLTRKTWIAALKQLMFSMNIGYGGLVSLSSYSKPDNNFFRDSLIVIFGDTLMSLIGGVAVFTTLGYLAQMTGKSIPEVVESGTALAFIVYPEAISTMSVPWLWNALFFLMLFFLGISSEIALVETFTGMIFDCFPKTKERKWLVSIATCGVCQLIALLMVTNAGWYWFNIFDEFTGSTCACLVAALEVIILSIYGWKQIKQDLIEMRGESRLQGTASWFGTRSPLFGILWATVCPILALAILALQLARAVPFKLELKKGQFYYYPTWAEVFGWTLSLGGCIPIFGFFFYKCYRFRREGKSFHYLFRPSRDLPSYSRYYEQKGLREPDAIHSDRESASSSAKSSPPLEDGPLRRIRLLSEKSSS